MRHFRNRWLSSLLGAILTLLMACSGGGQDNNGNNDNNGTSNGSTNSTTPTVPTAPSDVVVEAGVGTITVGWQDNSDDETEFVLLRSVDDGAFDELTTLPADSTTYEDGDVSVDSLYAYRVAAIGQEGRSELSEPSPPVRPQPEGVDVVDPDDPVGVNLNKLGVDTAPSERVDGDGTAFPGDYRPLGSTVTLGLDEGSSPQYELFVGGTATGNPASNQVVWKADPDGGRRVLAGQDEQLFTVQGADYDVAAGDFDGDGLDELVMVADVGGDLTVSFRDDAAAGFAAGQDSVVTAIDPIESLRVVAGDFDGDGTDGLAVALGKAGSADLVFLEDQTADFALADTITFAASVQDADTTLSLASGQLDRDAGQELAVVVNERFITSMQDDGVSRYAVIDDANADYSRLGELKFVQGQDGAVHSALSADVALGDVDADGLEEIVLGGPTEFHGTCELYNLLFIVVDDALEGHDRSVLGVKAREVDMGSACTGGNKKLRFTHVETGDLDGDGVDEFVAGPMLFDDWREPWTELGYIPPRQMYGQPVEDTTIVEVNSALEIVDFDGDGVSEVAHSMATSGYVRLYSVPDSGDALAVAEEWPVTLLAENGSQYRPLLATLNVDQDSMVARAVEDSHSYTMTEPIIVAALAAAPCRTDISQNWQACATSYGEGESLGESREQKVTTSASAHIGFKVTGGALAQSELTAKASFSREVSVSHGFSRTITKTVGFTTGPMEDAVIFTTVPYDRYEYEILQHDDVEMIGRIINVSLPREPKLLMVERSYFNDAQREGSLTIGDDVFVHTVGEPSSYRSRADKDGLVNALRADGRDALQVGPTAVAQSSGSTDLGIDVSEAHSVGGALAIGFSIDVEVVGATVLGGFSFGVTAEQSFSRTAGMSTSYGGTVGSISDPEEFRDEGYSYGMFTYLYEDEASGQQFEVIDYWVE